MTDPRFDITTRDLMADYDESEFDRVGKPITSETHDAGSPDDLPQPEKKQTSTLTDMLDDYVFFTPAVISATTPFDRDPVVEFQRQHPTDEQELWPVVIDSQEPFFRGLGTGLVGQDVINYDCRLYAIVKDRWELLRDTIAGIGIVSQELSYYARILYYETTIPDIFALKKATVITKDMKVPVTVFGVSSNRETAYLLEVQYPNLPKLVKVDPDAAILEESRRLFTPSRGE